MARIYKAVTYSDEWVQPGLIPQTSSDPGSEPDAIQTRDPVIPTDLTANPSIADFEMGYEQGFQAGIQQAETELQDKIQELKTLICSIPEAITKAQDAIKDEITDIVLMITQHFFIERQQDQHSVSQLVNHALKQVQDKNNIKLALHPQDLARIQQGEIKIDLGCCKNIKILANEQLTLGGCIIQNDHGIFHAGIERQIDNLKEMLLKMRS